MSTVKNIKSVKLKKTEATFNILVGKKECRPMQFEKAEEYIMNKLRVDLSPELVYHSIDHVKDVYNAAFNIGELENITVHEMQLLLTAACYHDAGFLIKGEGHEEESCRIAESVLPGFAYTNEDVAIICELIRATKLPQTPKNHLEQILADADLDYLGREDFFTISHKLYEELLHTGVVTNEHDWNITQINFLEKHQYFTSSAINLRQRVKEENLKQIKAITTLP
jgi:predicted metal-dependent HD superfamily phosphohydrolase